MARSEARIFTDIWNDEDFLALNPGEQRAFMFLLAQVDLAYDGVIPLRVARWSRKAAGLTAAELHQHLAGLARASFVIIDPDTEELLIRSFLRRDKVYRQPNVLRAAADHLPLVESPVLRAALAVEVRRIVQLGDAHKDSVPILHAMLDELDKTADQNPSRNPLGNPSGDSSDQPKPNPSADPPDMSTAPPPGERGEVTAVRSGFPIPRSPDPVPPPAGSAIAPATPDTVQTLIGEWIDHCRKRPPGALIGQVGRHIKAMLAEGIDPDDVRRGLATWHSKNLNPSALPSVVNEVMNGGGSRASPNHRSTGEQRADAARAAGRRVQAQLEAGKETA